jgi:hypothetical protein
MNKTVNIKNSILIFLLSVCGVLTTHAQTVFFCGSVDNNLYGLLQGQGFTIKAYDNLTDVLNAAKSGDKVFVVADRYPAERVQISAADYKTVKDKKIRLFVEYPSYIPDMKLSEVYEGKLERGVVTSDFFGKGLPAMSILGINGCHVIPVEVKDPLISFAKIAGFDNAQFGLKDTKTYPLLFRINDNVMISATRLSDFKTARFGPGDSWKSVWESVLQWMTKDKKFAIRNWNTDPYPAYAATAQLPANALLQSIDKGTKWLWNARLFIHPSWEKEIAKYQPANGDPNLFFGPPVSKDWLIGDGSRGIMEGHASSISYDGSQEYRYFIRGDVQGESALLLASAGKLLNDKQYTETAEKILDYLFYTSGFRGGVRDDKSNSSYGMISWANSHLGTYFNDDNARCILGVIGASAYMNNDRWNLKIVETILANLRTSSKQGFISNALSDKELDANSWKYYNERDYINLHPHFESWIWACYLWLYDKTGYKPLLDKAKSGISIMMDGYPDKWLSQNGIQQERARMILPLAWLVRVEDTPQHRQWLDTMVSKLLEYQDECGAIREELGNSSSDKNKILVTSNDAYGKNEAPLIAVNGDPVSDMLYTCNFGFFALNEAAKATKNPQYETAVTKLSDFLTRIQVRSDNHIDIDGAWFRAFDYQRWDYWASNADNGWGAWSTLTGWIQSWIVGTQGMVYQNKSYWDITKDMDMKESLENSLWMLEK